VGELTRTHRAQPTSAGITPADLMSRLYQFADDSMMGREAGTRGNVMATDFVAREMARMGLRPAGENGTWFQTVPVFVATMDTTRVLNVEGAALAYGKDWLPFHSQNGGRNLPIGTGTRSFDGARAAVSAHEAVAKHGDARGLGWRYGANRIVLALPSRDLIERQHRVVIEHSGADADVIVVRTDGDVLSAQRRVATREDPDDVARRECRGRVDERDVAPYDAALLSDREAVDRCDAEQRERRIGGDQQRQRRRRRQRIFGAHEHLRAVQALLDGGWHHVEGDRGDPCRAGVLRESSKGVEAPVGATCGGRQRNGEHDELPFGRRRRD
jgi:hypothetical protein